MGGIPAPFSLSLVVEKGLLPKNPRKALKGLGCGDATVISFPKNF
jgi:hypothetical protein